MRSHVASRHRALGDARAIWSFVQLLYREVERDRVDAAIKRILRIPEPAAAAAARCASTRLPEAPGVYLFYGENPLPLYIGKSINLRERVGAHFSQDWRSETDLRLSQEIRRIEHEETAGELGALLREAVLIKSRLPAHNRALRRKAEAGVAELDRRLAARSFRAAGIDCARLSGAYGPFASRASMRAALRELAAAAPPVLAAPGARAARRRTVLRAAAEALQRRVRRRGSDRQFTTRGSPRRWRRCAIPQRGRSQGAALVRECAATRRARRRPRRSRLVLARHRARRRRARRARRSAAARGVRSRRHAATAATPSRRRVAADPLSRTAGPRATPIRAILG